MDKFKLKHALRVLRKFLLQVWKQFLSKDFTLQFEKKGKHHEERD